MFTKRIAVVVVCIVASLPLAAAGTGFGVGNAKLSKPTELPALEKSFAEMYAEVNVARTPVPRRVAPNVVLEGSESAFVFPISGTGGGAGGTFFRTEAVVVNRRNIAQDVAFYYFPLGGGAANCTRPAARLRLDPNSWYLFTNLVQDIFGTTGFGAVIAFGVTPGGAPDSAARIDGNARIWTPQPGVPNGTTSQNFPSMSLEMPPGAQSIFGLRLDEFYRSNVGIFNYHTVGRNFEIFVQGLRGSTQYTLPVDACSVTQQPLPGGPYGSFVLTVAPHDGGGLYFSYAASVDNVTGDAWSVTGRSF